MVLALEIQYRSIEVHSRVAGKSEVQGCRKNAFSIILDTMCNICAYCVNWRIPMQFASLISLGSWSGSQLGLVHCVPSAANEI